jgi:hypothetical protein
MAWRDEAVGTAGRRPKLDGSKLGFSCESGATRTNAARRGHPAREVFAVHQRPGERAGLARGGWKIGGGERMGRRAASEKAIARGPLSVVGNGEGRIA